MDVKIEMLYKINLNTDKMMPLKIAEYAIKV